MPHMHDRKSALRGVTTTQQHWWFGICHSHAGPELLPSVTVSGSTDKGCPVFKAGVDSNWLYVLCCKTYISIARNRNQHKTFTT